MRLLTMLLVVLSGCLLRPVYKDVVATRGVQPGTRANTVRLQLVDADTQKPLTMVRVEAGEFKNKVSVLSDSSGLVELPIDAKLNDEIVVVSLPEGVRRAAFVAPAPQQVLPPTGN
jgi:hypothetical protein